MEQKHLKGQEQLQAASQTRNTTENNVYFYLKFSKSEVTPLSLGCAPLPSNAKLYLFCLETKTQYKLRQ